MFEYRPLGGFLKPVLHMWSDTRSRLFEFLAHGLVSIGEILLFLLLLVVVVVVVDLIFKYFFSPTDFSEISLLLWRGWWPSSPIHVVLNMSVVLHFKLCRDSYSPLEVESSGCTTK